MKHSRYLLGLDAVAVIAFVTIGRDNHDEAVTVASIGTTAAPFLVGMASGWLVTRAWRRPTAFPVGAGVVAVTVAVGMVLRWLTGSGTAPTFVFVAAAFLALMMLGWRVVAMAVERHRVTARV